MSFGLEFRELITSDPSINAEVQGNFIENLPDNFDLTKNWLVYSFNKTEQQNCIQTADLFSRYDVTVRIISPSVDTLDRISNNLIEYLNNKTYKNIMDIRNVGDVKSLNLEMNIYSCEIQFQSIFV